MSLIKFNRHRLPWRNMDVLDTEDFFFDDFFTKECDLPAMNVKENPKNYEIELAVPGFSKKDIEVSITDDILKVCAEKSKEEEEKDENYTRREFSYNSFNRSLKLPSNAKKNTNVKAAYKDGVLKLTVAKTKTEDEIAKKVIKVQ